MIVKRTIKKTRQKYEYKGKPINYDSYLHIKVDKEMKNKIKALAKYLEYSDFSKLVRDLIEQEMNNFEFILDTSVNDENDQYIVRKGE